MVIEIKTTINQCISFNKKKGYLNFLNIYNQTKQNKSKITKSIFIIKF
jgi:hypothetical protein